MVFDLPFSFKKEEVFKNKILISGIAIGFIVLWIGYSQIYKKTAFSIQRIERDFSDEDAKTDIANKLSALRRELNDYKRCFAAGKDAQWLIGRVSKLASESKLEIVSLNSNPLIWADFLLYCNIDVTARGTFNQLGDFVSSVEGSEEFLRIDKLSFKKDKDFLNAKIVISTYFWNDKT